MSSFCRQALSPIFHSKNSPHDASVFSSLLAAIYPAIFLYLCASQLFFIYFYFLFFNKTPGYLPFISCGHFSLSSCLMSFCSVLFCLGRCRIHWLVSFFFLSWACSLVFLSLGVSFLAICRAVLIYLVLFSDLFSGLSIFSDSVEFSYWKGSFFVIFLGLFCGSSLPCFFFSSFWFCSFCYSVYRAALSSENAYY